MEEVYNLLLTNNKIKYGDTIVVAVSGGPDSMALLHILSRLKKAIDIEVICAHVNHNLRKESYDEKIFVEKFCVNHQIVFESMVIEDYGDDNFHNEARSKRYNYFAQIVKKHHAKYLLTAHHADDLMETILMRIVRGSTLRGYSGFSEELSMGEYTILRPFIKNTKDEILEYLKKNKISYAQDSSNFKDVYTRNRFRKYIVPQFKKEDRNVHQKFYKFSRTLLEYNDYIDKQVKKVMKKVYNQETLNIEYFLKEERVIQMKIIYNILEHIYQDDLMLITDHHADLLYNIITSKRANVTIHLPNNIQAIKTYNNLVLVPLEQKSDEYEIELITYINLPNGKNIEVTEKSDQTDNFICRLDKDEVKFPLHVRSRKNGDKMYVKGMLGRKKINDIFIDEKISTHERDLWPIVVDSGDNIVWLPGLKKSKFDKTKKEKYDIILRYY
ncbi:MAG: tRNA lysidine(34) synthetase TilS [Bacilli bacterium]|nr:tRNA lysidine(34) synthetase TilS [Bacilli bacterium]MDD4607583.1 tRNA lysidine(34) synthetase TilS [Bacilli bacterium]